MHPVTKASGVAISALVAATATVLLLLPGYTRTPAPRGAVTSAAVVVASPGTASARPLSTPRPRPGAVGPTASPACRATGDGTAGARPSAIGRQPCRHHSTAPGQAHRGRPGGPPPPGTAGHTVGTVPAARTGTGQS
jgi:hypothetical protein